MRTYTIGARTPTVTYVYNVPGPVRVLSCCHPQREHAGSSRGGGGVPSVLSRFWHSNSTGGRVQVPGMASSVSQ